MSGEADIHENNVESRAQLDGDALEASAARLVFGSQKAQDKVVPVLENSPIKDLAYEIKSRLKSQVRVIRKIIEKRENSNLKEGDKNYGRDDITDGCGVRIVTLFQSEIPLVLGHLIDLIDHDPDLVGSPFVKGGLRELIVYTNRPMNDPYSIAGQVRTLAEKSGYSDKINNIVSRQSGYSSIHLIVDVEVEMEQVNRSVKQLNLPVEIQIRDIFEEGWGEIDHSLRYKPNGERLSDEHIEIKRWLSHLNALKTHCDGCSQQAWIIKERGRDNESGEEDDPLSKPSETAQDAIDLLMGALPNNCHPLIERIFQKRSRGLRAPDRVASRQLFRETLQLLNTLSEEAEGHLHRQTAARRPAQYHIDMERAFCLLRGASGETREKDLKAAVEIYKKIHDEYPEDVIPYYRHGVTIRQLKEVPRSIELFEIAVDLLGEDAEQTETQSKGRIGRSYKGHWICSALPRNLGYSYWRLADDLEKAPETKEERLKYLQQAIQFTEVAYKAQVDDDLELLKTVNNLTYYVWDYLSTDPIGAVGIDRARLAHLLAELQGMTGFDDCDNVDHLETLMVGHDLLGNKAIALRAAKRIMSVLYDFATQRSKKEGLQASEVPGNLHRTEKPIYDKAFKMVFADDHVPV